MKYILITIAALLMSCASKPAKDTSAATAPTTEAKSSATATTDVKKAANPAAAGDVTCTYGDIKRELKVVQSSERCTAEYTKDGSAQEIGTGSPNSTFCAEIIERVKNNLEAAGYKCK